MIDFNAVWVCDRLIYLNAKPKFSSNSIESKYIFWLGLLTYGQHEWTCSYILVLKLIFKNYVVC